MKTQKHEAMFWQRLDDGRVECLLCPHHCKLSNHQKGICNVREAEDGKLYTLYYGHVATGGQIDPIEKKPLYHFYPGSKALSFGSISCNLKCDHCQNYTLSQEYDKRMLTHITVEQILSMLKRGECRSVSWTYNEPTIHFETYYDWSRTIKEHGYCTTWVSNSYMEAEPLKKIAPFLDAINFDVKAFTEEFYQKYTKSRLQPVLESCILAKKLGLHLELTYLIISPLNDSLEEISRYLDWVEKELGYDVPLHFSRFYPHHRMLHLPPTPYGRVIEAVELAQSRKFPYVYAGNLYPNPYDDTICPSCGKIIIKRAGYSIEEISITKERKCQFCNASIQIIL